jgi:hypothetical protein
MIKLYQCKEEAFKYFPPLYIITDLDKLPQKYARYEKRVAIDYFFLKRFLYKIKRLRFPQNDHLVLSLTRLYTEKTPYYNTLLSVVSVYNKNLESKGNCHSTTKFKIKEVL